jgi:hypothetical protein
MLGTRLNVFDVGPKVSHWFFITFTSSDAFSLSSIQTGVPRFSKFRQFDRSLAPPAGSRAHAKNEVIQGLGLLPAIAITVPTYSLNDARSGPANLSASTSPLDVRSRRSQTSPVLANAKLIFMTFRERVRGAPLASSGKWTTIESKQQWRLRHAFLAQEIAPVCCFQIRVALNGIQMGYSFFVAARLTASASAERKRFDDSGRRSYDGDRKRL